MGDSLDIIGIGNIRTTTVNHCGHVGGDEEVVGT